MGYQLNIPKLILVGVPSNGYPLPSSPSSFTCKYVPNMVIGKNVTGKY